MPKTRPAFHEFPSAVLSPNPLTMQELMRDPVIAADGFTYERSAIEDWLSRKGTSPMTNEPLEHLFLIPNRALRNTINIHLEGS